MISYTHSIASSGSKPITIGHGNDADLQGDILYAHGGVEQRCVECLYGRQAVVTNQGRRLDDYQLDFRFVDASGTIGYLSTVE